jgi:16S rRNA (uracil1498-N3)-methyltransferase
VLVAPDVLDGPGPVGLDRDVEHHLRRVLRMRSGETVGLTDGAGRWRLATVVAEADFRLEVSSEVHVDGERRSPITIATAVPKGDRLDWLVQKVTELGVDRLVLLDCERSVVRWKGERAAKQLVRCRRVADDALRQSRRVWRLEIEGPVPAADVLGGYAVAEPGGRELSAGDRAVAIGPEGGWADAEIAATADRVGLGDTILRTETAAVAAAALCVTFNR